MNDRNDNDSLAQIMAMRKAGLKEGKDEYLAMSMSRLLPDTMSLDVADLLDAAAATPDANDEDQRAMMSAESESSDDDGGGGADNKDGDDLPASSPAESPNAASPTQQQQNNNNQKPPQLNGPRLISFDGDQTLYSDGENFERNPRLANYLYQLLRHGVVVAIVTAAGYEYNVRTQCCISGWRSNARSSRFSRWISLPHTNFNPIPLIPPKRYRSKSTSTGCRDCCCTLRHGG